MNTCICRYKTCRVWTYSPLVGVEGLPVHDVIRVSSSSSGYSINALNLDLECSHNVDDFRHASIVSAGVPRTTTGKICRKSPESTNTFPPNGSWSLSMMSRNVLSTASNACRCVIGASSQIIKMAL
ncbi:unnamed protein product [Phytophthora fragariaefolia]|uniref:Unnamed protein product n=1 Tax=Phytophthora fragariaefolia TaxID=1490495 RepID=A0A9W6XTJ0_9STRA|nr:unnamed protein product [Phytophthora fragariaefolia]